jgi:hypothetical protein
VLRPLDPYGIVIDQHLYRVSPEAGVDSQAEVVQPNVARLPDQACQLPESEEAPEAAGINRTSLGIPKDDLGRQILIRA